MISKTKIVTASILFLISFTTLADVKGSYFKDRNVYLVCIFAPINKGGVTSYHHFWHGGFDRGVPSDKHYSFATMNMTSKNLVLKDTSTKLNYVFYEWGLESDETSECKREIKTGNNDEKYLGHLTNCPSGETMFTRPAPKDQYANENVWYTGDNDEILSVSLGYSDTSNLEDSYGGRTNRIRISRISLKPVNFEINHQPCTKITKDFFIQQKKDFYKKREEDYKRIRDTFAL